MGSFCADWESADGRREWDGGKSRDWGTGDWERDWGGPFDQAEGFDADAKEDLLILQKKASFRLERRKNEGRTNGLNNFWRLNGESRVGRS